MKEELDYLRYHSFLNMVSKEFETDLEKNDARTQKRLLALTIRIVDAFAEIYGDHDIRKASSHVTSVLASGDISMN